MHGLNTIIKINKEQQEFIDHVMSTPYTETNLLDVWRQWKESKQEEAREQLSVHSD